MAAKYGFNVLSTATVSWQGGATANSAYPITNLYDGFPDNPAKAEQTSGTVRAVFGGAKTIRFIVIPPGHNLSGLTLAVTNNGGMASQNLVMPALGDDGLSLGGGVDLRSVAGNSATQWEVAITGAAANISIGELVFVETVGELGILWNADYGEAHPTVMHRMASRAVRATSRSVRQRRLRAMNPTEADRAAITSLLRTARGPLLPWWLWTNGDHMYVRFTGEDWRYVPRSRKQTDMFIEVEELVAGVGE